MKKHNIFLATYFEYHLSSSQPRLFSKILNRPSSWVSLSSQKRRFETRDKRRIRRKAPISHGVKGFSSASLRIVSWISRRHQVYSRASLSWLPARKCQTLDMSEFPCTSTVCIAPGMFGEIPI